MGFLWDLWQCILLLHTKRQCPVPGLTLINIIISLLRRYKEAIIRKWRSQKEIKFSLQKPRRRKILNGHLGTYTKKTYRQPSEQLFFNRWLLSNPNLTKNVKITTTKEVSPSNDK